MHVGTCTFVVHEICMVWWSVDRSLNLTVLVCEVLTSCFHLTGLCLQTGKVLRLLMACVSWHAEPVGT